MKSVLLPEQRGFFSTTLNATLTVGQAPSLAMKEYGTGTHKASTASSRPSTSVLDTGTRMVLYCPRCSTAV